MISVLYNISLYTEFRKINYKYRYNKRFINIEDKRDRKLITLIFKTQINKFWNVTNNENVGLK